MPPADMSTAASVFRLCCRRNQKTSAPRATTPMTQPTTMPPIAPPDRAFESRVARGVAVDDPKAIDAENVAEADDTGAELVELDSPGAAARTQPILDLDIRSMVHERS